MARIFRPSGAQLSSEAFCPLCDRQTSTSKTAAGPSGPNIPPVLVCEAHLQFRDTWAKRWAETESRVSRMTNTRKEHWLHGCYIEHRDPYGNLSIGFDLGCHAYARWYSGSVLVVAEKPMSLASPARKQWLRFSRILHREAAGTAHAPLRQQYSAEAERIEAASFDTYEDLGKIPQVVFVKPAELSALILPYSTVYITCELGQAKMSLHILGAGALVVDYTKRIAHNA